MNDTRGRTDPRERELAVTVPVYPQLPMEPVRGEGSYIITADGRRVLDLYGGHAVAALGYGHAGLSRAIEAQARRLLFQSNAVALDIRASAAERLVSIAPGNLERVFFVNSGAEANENALRMTITATGRRRILAIAHGFHGRTAAAAAVTWGSDKWYGFPYKPFDVDFIPRDDVAAARDLMGDDVAAVIFEPVQGVAGGHALSPDFIRALRDETSRHGALLIADEVQSGMGRSGHYFAVEAAGIVPDILTSAKSLGGGVPCGALVCTNEIAKHFGPGALGTTFGGGPLAAAAIVAVIDALQGERLLENVREREQQIRELCIAGPVTHIQGRGLLLGLICDRPASEVRDRLLEQDILTGTSADPRALRILAPLILESEDVARLAEALQRIPPARTRQPTGTDT